MGEVADRVKEAIKQHLNIDAIITVKHVEDYRSYRVDTKKIMDTLSYKPMNNINSIVQDLAEHLESYADFGDDSYHNIKTFKKLFPEN